MPPPLPTTLLAVTDTTSTAPATPTPTGLPRVLTASTRGPPSSLPSPPSPWSVAVSSALAFLAPMTRSTTEEGTTRGRLSPAMLPPLLTTLLVATATTSTLPATPTPTGPPRVSTRGRLPATATSPCTAL